MRLRLPRLSFAFGLITLVLANGGCNDVGDDTSPVSTAASCPTSTPLDASTLPPTTTSTATSTRTSTTTSNQTPDATAPSGNSDGSAGAEDAAAAADSAHPDATADGGFSDATSSAPKGDASIDAGAVDAAHDATVSTSIPSEAGTSDATTGLEAAAPLDAGQIDAAAFMAAELAVLAQYDSDAGAVTPTEQWFFSKDIANGDTGDGEAGTGFACANCAFFNDCLHNQNDGLVQQECGDLNGTAAAGNAAGTAKSDLCEDVLACIFSTAPTCAAPDGVANLCYCGAANMGNACQTIAKGAGTCAQIEADGLEFPITDPHDILQHFGDVDLGAGRANDIMSCLKNNMCSTCWQ